MAEPREMDRGVERVAAVAERATRRPRRDSTIAFAHADDADGRASPHQFHIVPSSSRATGR